MADHNSTEAIRSLIAKSKDLLRWVEGESAEDFSNVATGLRWAIRKGEAIVCPQDFAPFDGPSFRKPGTIAWITERTFFDINIKEYVRASTIEALESGSIVRYGNHSGYAAFWRENSGYLGSTGTQSRECERLGCVSVQNLIETLETWLGLKSPVHYAAVNS